MFKSNILEACFLIAIGQIIIMASAQAKEPADPPGRNLSDGTWQPRNTHATLPDPAPGMPAQESRPDDRNHIASIDWEPEVRITHNTYSTFYSAIAAAQNGIIHIETANAPSFEPIYNRSLDNGLTWEDPRPIGGNSGIVSSSPCLFQDSNYITFICSGSSSIVSTNYGSSWLGPRQISIGGGDVVKLGSRLHIALRNVQHQTEYFTSDDFGITWTFRSATSNMDGDLGLGANAHKLHIALESDGQEVYYMYFDFQSQVWSRPIMISDDTTHCSFNPRVIAWGASNVAAFWLDYEYSPYSWTGDLILRRSTNDGNSWLPEQQITFNHLAFLEHDKNIFERNDSLFLVYEEVVLDGETNAEEVFFNLSTDMGETWGDPIRLTYSPWRSFYPSINLFGNQINVAFCDARDDTLFGNHNSLYYKRGFISGSEGIKEDDRPKPEGLSINAYPNPFNSSVLFTISNMKGGEAEISIYDIQGRIVQSLDWGSQGGDEKIVWDATDASGKKVSSGIYFARASTAQTEKTIKLLYLK